MYHSPFNNEFDEVNKFSILFTFNYQYVKKKKVQLTNYLNNKNLTNKYVINHMCNFKTLNR